MAYEGIDVVIPARNEQDTIGVVVSVFKAHPAIGKVIVVVDRDTADDTAILAVNAVADNRHGWVLTPEARGKGQCVREGLKQVVSKYVVFCDADVRGLTYDHVSLLIGNAVLDEPYVTIGVPDIPSNYPTERLWAWPWVSGQRCVPTALVRPLYLHGYLMETQINAAAKHTGLPLNFEWLKGLQSSYYMSERRIREMMEDAEWGHKHGILP
jgi:glycosyltransferase involved in cell wall biosynthesis